MSGISGVYLLDGQPVRRENLEKMNSMLAHRGPDGAGIWCEGGMGLGHRLLWSTEESLHEHLPMASANGDLILTADARIDNREDLIHTLAVKDPPGESISDSSLILAAYERWGTRCPERLLGDFAFVLWDRPRQTLFCARDHFGVKPLYYHYHPGRLFACASEIKALFCLPEVGRHLNEVQVADYLAGMSEDKTSTFYRDIVRLPPAQSLTIDGQGMRLYRYWALDPSAELRLESDEEYTAAWRDIFIEAVRCRLRSAFPIGSHLSGGLDSSAVTCVARQLLDQSNSQRLHTFSNVFEAVPECDERPFISAVLARGGYVSHYIRADQASPLADVERVLWHQDEALIGPNHVLPWELNRAAQQAGVRVVLDGFDGDTTVSHGAGRFAELARAGEWDAFALEADAVARHFPVSPLGLLQTYGLPCLEELARGQRWMAFAAAIARIHKYFGVSRRDLVWQRGLRPLIPSRILGGRGRPEACIDPIVNREFARRVGLQERMRVLSGERSNPARTAREDQWRALTAGLFTSILEISDRSAAAFSLEGRHPFMDKRLIEFCLALPAEQKLHQGWSRIVMRRGMSGILPEEIRWRGGKTDMNPNFLRGLLRKDRSALDEVVLRDSDSIARYVDIDALRQAHERLTSQERVKIDDAMAVWKAVTLAYWLRSTGFGTRNRDPQR